MVAAQRDENRGGATPVVSVIIPAHNAASTLPETLDALLAQEFRGWEAIVVDDGSRDGTAEVASAFTERDERIRWLRQSQGGESAARNTGIARARAEWLLFLDADDWLLPSMLAQMMVAVAVEPGLDAVHCGWARVTPDGRVMQDEFCDLTGDLFDAFARCSALAIHACIVRRSRALAAGGFDTSFQTGADWDFWQRVARGGARFGAVRQSLARYRLRPGSASTRARQMLIDGLRIISTGHAPDPRVANPLPAHACGLPIEYLPVVKLTWVCWPAGLVLGGGEDARPLLDAVREERCPGLAPYHVAQTLFRSVPLATHRPPSAWDEIWPRVADSVQAFLHALEDQAMARRLAYRTLVALERMILEHSAIRRPCTLGRTHAVRVEVTEPIVDVDPPGPAEFLHCAVERDGERLGVLHLPVCDGHVPGRVIADAIAAEYAWQILGQSGERLRRSTQHAAQGSPPVSRAMVSRPRGGVAQRRSLAERLLRRARQSRILSRAVAGARSRLPGRLRRLITETWCLPILMYHRVAPDGAPATARYRVTPEAFEQQLRALRRAGYRSVSLEEWRSAMASRHPLPGRAVLLTFDDGYRDFLTHAWPLLRRYRFSATVFLVADLIGQTNRWDQFYGEEVPLLGWEEIRHLQAEGVRFESHSATHPPMTALSAAEVVREASHARDTLQRGLGKPVTAIAYPHGDTDPVVQHLVGRCGYSIGLSCTPGRSSFDDRSLCLPRIEITGYDTLSDYVSKLHG